MNIEDRCGEECRDFRVVHDDYESFPETRGDEETFPDEAEGDHVCCKPVEVNELKEEEESRDDEVPLIVLLVPLPEFFEEMCGYGYSWDALPSPAVFHRRGV